MVSGNSPFDRWYYGGEEDALTEQQKRGFDLFVNEGRCVSCHVIEQTQALFTDNRFHNIGVGINNIQDDVPELAGEFLEADMDPVRGGRGGAHRPQDIGARALRHHPRTSTISGPSRPRPCAMSP